MNIQVGRDAELAESKRSMASGNYLSNAWYVAAWSDDVKEGQLLGRIILKEPVVIYRMEDGKIAALADRCAHRFAPLSMGKIVGRNRIQCPYHGLEYDTSGACMLQPHGTKNIPSRARVKSYPVIEKHKAIWIWMGDQPADESKVPNFSVLDNVPELYSTKRDGFTIKANVELIIDNLLDLSHTSYLHEGILGNAETVESDIGVDLDGSDVVVSRYAKSAKPPGMNKLMWPDVPDKVDKFTEMRWMAPSTLRLISGVCLPGSTKDSGSGYHAIHLLTPETDRTTHYFFTAVRFGVFSKGEELNRQIQQKIAETRRFAFEEQDAPVIEAQQRIIDDAVQPVNPVILAIDVGVVRYKQVLNRMIAAEQAS
ncbi:MAG: aromatic ring-hydroxylating dioxygenase subunit alpha [Alphaproteobacteria bacterium]|nr:aromatic ring-hydroxylating dioxygenase subunit alpha [Alphaproteobacteria bacterium]